MPPHAAQEAAADTVGAVGYNPFRSQVKHRGDLAIVAAALAVIAALVAWALFG